MNLQPNQQYQAPSTLQQVQATSNNFDLNIFDEFKEILKQKDFTDKMKQLTQPRNGRDMSSSIINQIFASFKRDTDQEDQLKFDIGPKKFIEWKMKRNLKDLSHRTFTRVYKKLHLAPKLHYLASRGLIDKAVKIELWSQIEPRLSDYFGDTDGAQDENLKDDREYKVDLSSKPKSQQYSCCSHEKEIQQSPSVQAQNFDFNGFQELHVSNLSFKEKIRKLTEASNGMDSASSLINQIFYSFRTFTDQLNQRDFEIKIETFEEWKTAMELRLLKLSIITFRKIYKKLHLYPKLHYLASRGFIQKEIYIEGWTRIEPHLPENLDNIKSVEDIDKIEREHPARSRKRKCEMIPQFQNSTHCSDCKVEFSFQIRRYHCQECGKSFCRLHSRNSFKGKRMCDRCLREIFSKQPESIQKKIKIEDVNTKRNEKHIKSQQSPSEDLKEPCKNSTL